VPHPFASFAKGGRTSLRHSPAVADLQADPLPPLQVGYDLKQVAGRRISLWTNHLVHRLHVQPGVSGQLWKPDSGVNVSF
jgi:hypothetical protein